VRETTWDAEKCARLEKENKEYEVEVKLREEVEREEGRTCCLDLCLLTNKILHPRWSTYSSLRFSEWLSLWDRRRIL